VCPRRPRREGCIPSDVAPARARRTVTVYVAEGCGLCREALELLHEAQRELAFALDVVDIAGDEELEARYRVLLPVVEVDGEQAFVYHVDPVALRNRIG
jgi:glutaredoxin